MGSAWLNSTLYILSEHPNISIKLLVKLWCTAIQWGIDLYLFQQTHFEASWSRSTLFLKDDIVLKSYAQIGLIRLYMVSNLISWFLNLKKMFLTIL